MTTSLSHTGRTRGFSCWQLGKGQCPWPGVFVLRLDTCFRRRGKVVSRLAVLFDLYRRMRSARGEEVNRSTPYVDMQELRIGDVRRTMSR